MTLGYGLDVRGSRVRFPVGAVKFSLHHRVQNGSGAHPAFYPMGSFLGSKVAGEWSPSITKVKIMSGAIHPLPQYAFMK
jgi:hypothetical protein